MNKKKDMTNKEKKNKKGFKIKGVEWGLKNMLIQPWMMKKYACLIYGFFPLIKYFPEDNKEKLDRILGETGELFKLIRIRRKI
jgi:hypothetical protein